MSRLIEITVPPRTVKMEAKALSICPQRCVEGQKALIHNCTDSSVQLINSSPIYMTSNDSESHIIAEEKTKKTAWRVSKSQEQNAYKSASKGDESIYLFQILESKYETLYTSPLETKRQNVNEVIHQLRRNKLYKNKRFCCLHWKSFSKDLSKWQLQEWYFTHCTVATSSLHSQEQLVLKIHQPVHIQLI